MFVDKKLFDELDYVLLLDLLNAARGGDYVIAAQILRAELTKIATPHDIERSLNHMELHRLVTFRDKDFEDASVLKDDGHAVLTWLGLAFLVNHANEYVLRVQKRYREIPEKLIASLVPYLNLQMVPAADRYVSVADNKPDFEALIRELEIIRDEIARDENKNEYPIEEKRAIVAELDGVLAQLQRGYIRLSTLTTRVRPLLHDLADTCKDIAIIAGAVTGGLWAIQAILAKMM